MLAQCFEPIVHATANVMVLGSMPGRRSLSAGEYYAHPRNAFWRIMADIRGIDSAAPYRSRVAALRAARVAVWDVLRACRRAGSLDSAILPDSRVANDFREFFRRFTRIELVVFNGTEAQRSYTRLVLPGIARTNIRYLRLPSTSPANTLAFERKVAAWRRALGTAAATRSAEPARKSGQRRAGGAGSV